MATIPVKKPLIRPVGNVAASQARLTGNLAAATDPAKQARINKELARLNARKIPAQTTPRGEVTTMPVTPQATGTPESNAAKVTSLNARLASTVDPIQKARLEKEIARVGGRKVGVATTNPPPIPAPETPPAPVTTQPLPAPVDATALFPSMNSMLPASYEGSPLYKFQRDAGMKSLERLMAARGLTNSGAEIEANSKFLGELGAKESEVTRGYAQQEADRLMRLQENTANRTDNQSNEMFRRRLETARLMADQSPMGSAYDAAGGISSLLSGLGAKEGAVAGSDYTKVSGGGGGGVAPMAPPPTNNTAFNKQILDMMNSGASQDAIWDMVARFGGKNL